MPVKIPAPTLIIQNAFPGIPKPEADEMVAIGEVHTYPVGSVLCRENADEETFYVILDGGVDVTKVINEDEERLLKQLYPGDFFGEMGLIHNAPRAATVTTSSPTKVLEIHKSSFTRLLEKSTTVSYAMVCEVSRRLRENDELAIEDLQLKARELAVAYQRMAQEEFARREFLTAIAHELRTPLTASSGFLAIAQQAGIDSATLDMALGTVASNVQRIISLVNDILFLQEVELVMPEMHVTDMGEIVSSAVEIVRKRAGQSKHRLLVNIDGDLPPVWGHERSLKRAVAQLLDNAIKFSPGGGDVHILVSSADGKVSVRIRDHGVGIGKNVLPKIFDRFYHLDKVGDDLFGGLGLGLAITQQVIEQHNGHIAVESKEGQGSTFTIFLDIADTSGGKDEYNL